MALPIIHAPEYTITLPISNKTIKVRPFIVKEEKMLLTAAESNEISETVDILFQILNNCTFDKIDINTMAITDIEYLLLKMRGFSKGEEFEIYIKCKNTVKNKKTDIIKECGHVNNYVLNINDIEISNKNNLDGSIELTDTIGIKMRPPSTNLIKELLGDNSEVDTTITGIIECIESIWNGDEVMYTKDFSNKEIEEFIDQFTRNQLQKIKDYIDNLPKISIKVDHKCDECGHKETLYVSGLNDFLV